MAAIGNFRVLGTTATQALIAYTAPDGNACTIQVSTNATLTPLALDVDPGTFANSDSDLSRPSTVTSGLARTVVLGQRTVQYATAGTYSGVRHFSRSLEAYAPYFGNIACPSTGDTLAFTFTTTNIPLGQVYGDPWLTDSNPGDQPFPEALAGLTPESFNDPETGANTVRVTMRGNQPTTWSFSFGSAFNQGQTTPCDSAGPWSNPCGIATGGSGSTAVGTSTAPIVLRLPVTNTAPWTTNYLSGFSIEQIGVTFTGYVNSANSAFRVMDACLSANGGVTCAGPVQKITAPQTSGAMPIFGEYNSTQYGVNTWLFDSTPRLNSQEIKAHSGTGTVIQNSGNYYLQNNTSSGDSFSLYWITGGAGTVRISSNNDACTSPPAASTAAEYRIASFTDPTGGGLNGNYIQVSGTPPTGSVYWCEELHRYAVARRSAYRRQYGYAHRGHCRRLGQLCTRHHGQRRGHGLLLTNWCTAAFSACGAGCTGSIPPSPAWFTGANRYPAVRVRVRPLLPTPGLGPQPLCRKAPRSTRRNRISLFMW